MQNTCGHARQNHKHQGSVLVQSQSFSVFIRENFLASGDCKHSGNLEKWIGLDWEKLAAIAWTVRQNFVWIRFVLQNFSVW